MNKTVRTITRSAICLAMLIVLQWLFKMIGVQLLTGSVVNLVLLVSVCLCGLYGGLVIAAVSPFMALLLGITPFPSILIVLFIALGNMVYVTIFYFIYKLVKDKKQTTQIAMQGTAVLTGAAVKCGILYLGIVKILLPIITNGLPEAKQAAITANLTAAFGVTQLFTALIGGVIAIIVLKLLPKALKK